MLDSNDIKIIENLLKPIKDTLDSIKGYIKNKSKSAEYKAQKKVIRFYQEEIKMFKIIKIKWKHVYNIYNNIITDLDGAILLTKNINDDNNNVYKKNIKSKYMNKNVSIKNNEDNDKDNEFIIIESKDNYITKDDIDKKLKQIQEIKNIINHVKNNSNNIIYNNKINENTYKGMLYYYSDEIKSLTSNISLIIVTEDSYKCIDDYIQFINEFNINNGDKINKSNYVNICGQYILLHHTDIYYKLYKYFTSILELYNLDRDNDIDSIIMTLDIFLYEFKTRKKLYNEFNIYKVKDYTIKNILTDFYKIYTRYEDLKQNFEYMTNHIGFINDNSLYIKNKYYKYTYNL